MNAKQARLIRRVKRNFEDYRASILKLDRQRIFDRANEIAAYSRVSHYLQNMHGYSEDELDYLLRFQNPLELITDHYRELAHAELHTVVARVCDTKDHTGDYLLMPTRTEQEPER
jgi:hypothetical protein